MVEKRIATDPETDSESSTFSFQLLERRVFLIYIALTITTTGYGLLREYDGFLFSDFEDYAIFILAVISLAVFAVLRGKKESVKSVQRANKIATILALLSFGFSVYGIVKEIRTVYDWQDEFPPLLFGIFIAIFKREKGARREPEKITGGSKELRAFLSQDFTKIPLWALNADQHFLTRKLESSREREKSGKPANKRYSEYETNLKKRLEAIETELERRMQKGSE